MKRIFGMLAVAAGFFVADLFAAGNNHSGGSTSSVAAHHSSAAPAPAAPVAVAPRLGGIPHSGNLPTNVRATSLYRPAVTYHNGNRTLNYPAVGVSHLQRSAHSNLATANNSARGNRGSGNLRASGNTQHAGAVNLAAKHKLDPQSSARLRNWNGNVSTANQARQNHLNNLHHHHDHDWWRHHCVAIIFFDWGWWGWYDGWWYPAWGYDPYSYYGYNEPIYGYGDLSPEQIIASVQVALQQQGYYNFAIDGRMGPQTRAAIGQYQADHRLPVTYGIDQPTLGALGVIR